VFERLRRRFTEAQIVELTLRIALCGFFNRVNDAPQIEVKAETPGDVQVTRASLRWIPHRPLEPVDRLPPPNRDVRPAGGLGRCPRRQYDT